MPKINDTDQFHLQDGDYQGIPQSEWMEAICPINCVEQNFTRYGA